MYVNHRHIVVMYCPNTCLFVSIVGPPEIDNNVDRSITCTLGDKISIHVMFMGFPKPEVNTKLYYSQTCIQQPPIGPQTCGCLKQVAS